MNNQFKMKCIALLCLLAFACPAKNSMLTFAVSNDLYKIIPLPEPEEVPTGHLKNDITYNQAAFLLQNFLANTDFYNVAITDGFSGFLSKQTLNQIIPRSGGDPATSGLLVYLCYNKIGNEIFIAFKHGTGFTEQMSVPTINSNDVYYKTKFSIIYKGGEKPSLEEVKEELLRGIEVDSTENDTIMGNNVLLFSNEFKTTFKAKDDVTKQEVECNNFSFGFIPLNELNLVRFPENVPQDELMGIRFYLGFDNTEFDNRIRVFFVGSYGNENIIKPRNLLNPKTIYGRFIERSRP